MRKKRPILKLIVLNCSHCNKEFHKYPSQVKSNKSTVFCGNQCVIDYRKIHWKGKINRICIECNKEFKIYNSVTKKCKSAGKYCSKKCQSSRNKILKCLVCKKEYKDYISNFKRGRKFCSPNCSNNRKNPIEYFFKNISAENHKNNCWEWIGKKDKDGYGIISFKKSIRAHRYSIELHQQKIPKSLLACHKCNNPCCVNPDHLYIGTHLDNARDKVNNKKTKLLARI